MKKERKHYSPEEKVAILRRHLLDKEPISKLCDELGLQPTVLLREVARGSGTAQTSVPGVYGFR
jgi:transposase-like protein